MTVGIDVAATQNDSDSKSTGTSGSQTTQNSNDLTTLLRTILVSTFGSSSGGTQSKSATGATTGTSDTKQEAATSQSVTGSSADSIDISKGIFADAMSKANDTSATDNIVNSILRKSAIAFAPTVSQANATGSYNGTSVGLLQGNAEAAAVQDAAGQVLNYKSTMEQIANTSAGNLLNATKISSGSSTAGSAGSGTQIVAGTSTGSSSNQNVNQSTTATTENDTIKKVADLFQNIFSNSESQSSTSGSSTTEKGGVSLSVVCTEMMYAGKMSRQDWFANMREFHNYSPLGKQAYYAWAIPLTEYMRRHPLAREVKIVQKIFLARSKKKLWARLVIFSLCVLPGIYLSLVQPELFLLHVLHRPKLWWKKHTSQKELA